MFVKLLPIDFKIIKFHFYYALPVTFPCMGFLKIYINN